MNIRSLSFDDDIVSLLLEFELIQLNRLLLLPDCTLPFVFRLEVLLLQLVNVIRSTGGSFGIVVVPPVLSFKASSKLFLLGFCPASSLCDLEMILRGQISDSQLLMHRIIGATDLAALLSPS